MPGRTARRWRHGAVLWALLGLVACAPAGGPEPAEIEKAAPAPPVEREWPAGELRPEGRVATELGETETHRWRLLLAAGTFVRLTVEPGDVDVGLTWLDPAGEVVLAADRPPTWAPELVVAVTGVAGEHVLTVEALGGGGRYVARIEALGTAGERERLAADAYRRFRGAEELPREERETAAAVWKEALAAWRELGEPLLEGEVLYRQGVDHYEHRESAEAVAAFGEAAEVFEAAGQRRWEALALSSMAVNLARPGDPEAVERAAEQYRALLPLARELADRSLEGKVLNALALGSRRRGEVQAALADYEAALAVLPEDEVALRPQVLHNLGVLHSLYFDDHARAVELLAAARDGWSPADPSYERHRASTFNQLGRVAFEQGDLAAAREHFTAALALREGDDDCGRALTLARLALVEERRDRRREADAHSGRALGLVAGNESCREAPTVRMLAAELAETRGDWNGALAGFDAARALAEARGDRTLLAGTLVGLARVRRARAEPGAALTASGRALELAQGVRPTVLREDLRTAFFSTVQDRFDLHLALLAERGDHRAAWATAEAARAQALGDLLAEAGAGLRRTADPARVERERRLQRRLNDSVSRNRPAEEIEALVEELERARAEVRRATPRYAELVRPRPLSVENVQRDLLDDESLLLEVRLGTEESWLWAIGREAFSAHPLPARAEIEPLARETAEWQRSLDWPGIHPPAPCELSRLLLGPVAGELGSRRLVLVLDGALEAVSFAALPDPRHADCLRAPPLVAVHEIVHLPSAATLATQRRQLAGREAVPGWVAVLADPVYEPSDPRLAGLPAPAASTVPERREPSFARLPHAGREAAAIDALAPERVLALTGLDAAKGALTGAVAGHRVLHLAVHGVLHPEEPLLSHLALSAYDAAGRPVDGRLYAHEIYDLDLPVELAVLSACDTARGRFVPGEGVVAGLPRALLYAGAARVLVSLWALPDESTADLMAGFYRRLLRDGLPPGRALQEAQREMWRAGQPPWRWAGLMFQGDWRPLPPFGEAPLAGR